MNKKLQTYLFLLTAFIFTNCKDKFDEYYERPEWLADPIYQQLQTRGNFTHFLAAIDKTGYKNTLSTAGYWTIFAPTDAAFEQYFTQKNIKGIADLDEAAARKIVNYSLVYNSFTRDKLSDYQSNTGWVENNAFRRRTTYYNGVYSGTANGVPAKLIAANRNAGYILGDNNNKYIPYFTTEYFTTKSLSAADFNFFFPNVPFTGFNVLNAAVTEPNIQAENGMIHIIDKVVEAQPSIDEYLADKPQYSRFREILEKYGVQNPLPVNQPATDRYRTLTGANDPIYVKLYRPTLGFSPNNENFLKQTDNDGQTDAWSIFVPTNEVLDAYLKNVLLEHYASLDVINPQIIYDFLNAHLWQTTVWPTRFNSTRNTVGEPARFNKDTDVVDAKVLSNGMFYGTNKVQESDAFHSVFGKAYLDPKYFLMTQLLQRELRYTLSNPATKYTLFLLSDQVLTAAGYSFDAVNNTYLYNGTGTQALERLTRLISLHTAFTRFGELNDLTGEGIIETYGGEFIKYKDNKVFAAGNVDANETPAILKKVTASNGVVHYPDRILKFSEKTLGNYIKERGTNAAGAVDITKPYGRFYQYLSNSTLFNAATGDINGVASGVYYTALIPTNTAILAAVTAGLLPASPTSTDANDKEKINKFILYHILNKKSIAANGNATESGAYETIYKLVTGGVTTLNVQVTSGPIGKFGQMKVTDMRGRIANVILGADSNVLGNRVLIHQIDNYLQYVD